MSKNIFANPGRTKTKEAIFTAAGLDPAGFPDSVFEMEVGELRTVVAEIVLENAGFHPAEIRATLDVNGKLAKRNFPSVLAVAAAGLPVISERVLDALDGQKLFHMGKLPRVWKRAFGNIPRARKVTKAIERIKDGQLVFMASKKVLNAFLSAVDDEAVAKLLKDNTVTSEDFILDTVQGATVTPELVAKLLNGGRVENGLVKATYGYREIEIAVQGGVIEDKQLLDKIVSYGRELNRQQAVLLFALSLRGVTAQSTMEAKLSSASSVFEAVDYGYTVRMTDSREESVIRGKVGILELIPNAKDVSFKVDDVRDYESVIEAARLYVGRGVPVAFESQVGWLTVGEGALASLVGLRMTSKGYYEATFGTDASKKPKLLNRQKLATGAVALTLDLQGRSTVTRSGLGVVVNPKTGQLAYGYGTRMKVWYSDFVLGGGSGVAYTAPGFTRIVAVEKTMRATVNAVDYAKALKVTKADKKEDRAKVLLEFVKSRLEINRDPLHYGDAILTVGDQVLVRWDGRGMDAVVVTEAEFKVKATSESVSITVKVRASYEDYAHKFRADGVKATGLEYELICSELGKVIAQPDLLLTVEEIKGVGTALMRAWADDVVLDLAKALKKGWVTQADHDAGCVKYDPNVGLNAEQLLAFVAWRDAHSKIVDISIKVNAYTFRMMKAICARATADATYAKESGIDPAAFTFGDDGMTITQKTKVVEASVVLGIEVSTVRENITTQALIGEQLAVFMLLDHAFGLGLWTRADGQRQAVLGMFDMALTDAVGDVVEVTEAFLTHDRDLHGRALLEYYQKEYPTGLTLTRNGHPVCTLRFDSLCELGAMTASGSATGIALAVEELLEHLHIDNANENGWAARFTRLFGKVNTAAEKWVKSKGIKARVTKSRKVLAGRKVKTTVSPSIPEGYVGIHPDDPMVTEGKLDNEMAILFGRPPMVSMAFARIVLTYEAPIGTLLVNAHEWAAGNEGDGDGDPCFFMVIRDDNAALRLEESLKESPFGLMGYAIAHLSRFRELV